LAVSHPGSKLINCLCLTVRLAVLAAWLTNLAARGVQLRHLLAPEKGLGVLTHARVTTSAHLVGSFLTLAVTETFLIIFQVRLFSLICCHFYNWDHFIYFYLSQHFKLKLNVDGYAFYFP
jgi:hypothetical protein